MDVLPLIYPNWIWKLLLFRGSMWVNIKDKEKKKGTNILKEKGES